MNEIESMDKMQIVIQDNDERVCSFYCSNYGEFINFLHYCKKYRVPWYPRMTAEGIPQDYLDRTSGIGGVVSDYWFDFGSNECIQCIYVDIGLGE